MNHFSDTNVKTKLVRTCEDVTTAILSLSAGLRLDRVLPAFRGITCHRAASQSTRNRYKRPAANIHGKSENLSPIASAPSNRFCLTALSAR
jgi:hypothetical protein